MSMINIAETEKDFNAFLNETINRSNFSITKIGISEQDQWSIKNGALSHCSGGFFDVAGLKNNKSKEEHLVLYQPQGAFTGLALFKTHGQVYLLLQARIEPGNSNIGQYGPTVQSTPANYSQAHGGKKTNYIDLFTKYSPNVNMLATSHQNDLGKRYFQKNKSHVYIELKELIATEDNTIWVNLNVILKTLFHDNFLNTDLRSLLGIFDWDLYLADDELSYNPPLSDDSGLYTYGNNSGKGNWELSSLHDLNGWTVNDEGIIVDKGSDVWVNMFATTCIGREVKNWIQPLMCCSERGKIILMVKKVEPGYEYLISLQSEFGISGEISLLPSYLIYQNDNHVADFNEPGGATIIAEIIQSEEGGRFYQNEMIYQIMLVDDSLILESTQRWISEHELKSVLKSSCRVSIQLRIICSLILDKLNPYSLAALN